jgi:HlyD family secretion protein
MTSLVNRTEPGPRILVVLSLVVGLVACEPQPPIAPAEIRKEVAQPKRPPTGADAAGVTTSGTVRLKSGASVRVGSQVSGIVRKLNVTVGSRIARGDVIAQIDPKPLQARVDQAQAQVDVAEIALAKAQRDSSRVRPLGASGALPAQQLEDLEWQVKATQAQLQKALVDLDIARINLQYTTIRAPISGIVSAVSTQEGETVAAAFAAPTFVTIVDAQSLELVAMVDETDIAGVRSGDKASFTVEAYPGRFFHAVVERIDPTPLVISGVVNYPVVAGIEPEKMTLRPEMTATISIATQRLSASADRSPSSTAPL